MNRILRATINRAITGGKKIVYWRRGEPVRYGSHTLRYVPGTRPPRFKYLDSGDPTTQNELRQIDFFLNRVNSGDFVLDVGAHVGQYAVLLGALSGSAGNVLSFEPDPLARSVLDRNIALNKLDNVKVEAIALSDTNGTHTFFSLGGNSMSSLAKSGLGTSANSEDVRQYDVHTMRMDDFLSARRLRCPEWIKIDTEGAEVLILKGAPETLKCARAILCEIHPYAWGEFGSTFDELLSIVEASGRKIRYLDPKISLDAGAVYGTMVIE